MPASPSPRRPVLALLVTALLLPATALALPAVPKVPADVPCYFVIVQNDCFSNAEYLFTGNRTHQTSTVGATSEPNEPSPCALHGSVWYSYDSTQLERVTLRTTGSTYDTVIAVYGGTQLRSLALVGCGETSSGNGNDTFSFTAVPGGHYRIQVGGSLPDPGWGTLNFTIHQDVANPSCTLGPVNDCFGFGTIIPSLPYHAQQSTKGATTEFGEPPMCPDPGQFAAASVWYEYQSPVAGQTLQIGTGESNYQTTVAVYTRDASGLHPVGCSPHANLDVPFLLANTRYAIQIAGINGEQGTLDLSVRVTGCPTGGPVNDCFAKATRIGSFPFSSSINASAAGTEPDEPGACQSSAPATATVWFAITPSETGSYHANVTSADSSVEIALFSDTLTVVSCTTTPTLAMSLDAGVPVWIRVNSPTRASAIVFRFAGDCRPTNASPANDCFNNALSVTTFPSTITQNAAGATREPGEPRCGGEQSVWFDVTTPTSGPVVIDTIGSNYDTMLGAFTGTDVSALTQRGCDDNGGGNGASSLSLTMTAGATVHVQVSTRPGIPAGNLVLHVSAVGCSNSVFNNCFANAASVFPTTTSFTQSTSGADTEAREPVSPCSALTGATVWFRWIASTGGNATLDTIGSNYDTVLTAYAGSTLDTLVPVACNDDVLSSGSLQSSVSFNATPGTYWIQVGGFRNATGSLAFRVQFSGGGSCTSGAPGNDCIANAGGIPTSPRPWTTSQSSVGATNETGEPPACTTSGASVWYQLAQVTSARTTTIDLTGSNYDTVLSVHTGTIGTMTSVACNDDIGGGVLQSRLSFTQAAGIVYYVRIAGFQPAGGAAQEGTLQIKVS